MEALTAKDAKYGFGQPIDLAPAEPMAVTSYMKVSARTAERRRLCLTLSLTIQY
jgi:hypothetical protein